MAQLKPQTVITPIVHGDRPERRPATLLVGPRRVLFTLLLGLLGTSWVIWLYHERQLFVTSVFKTVRPTGHNVLVRRQVPSTRAAPNTTGVLNCFQVAQPVLSPDVVIGQSKSNSKTTRAEETTRPSTDSSCSVLLMDHVFGQSYGKPFIGNYTPPNCAFNRVIMNFTVVSEGRQFDRLALMYFGDTEVWRTSTAEPTTPPGIAWTYMKDMTHYMYFWKSPQSLIFDLGNNVDEKYTGSFNATLTATFYQSSVMTGDLPADLIVPISQRLGVNGTPSAFIVPQQNATNTISFPRNVKRAVFSVSACGQADEEFWWSNFLQSDISAFDQTMGPMPGWSPFREIQVLIDGQLAGVQWPFPVIFTGGVVPSLHRPIVGLDAFDLQEHQIDISPFLPLLCDGGQHTFTILVAGLDDDDGHGNTTLSGTVNDNWVITGKIFLWLGAQDVVTTGVAPVVHLNGPEVSFTHATTRDATGVNKTLMYNLSVYRTLSVTGSIGTSNGGGNVTWSQTLSFTASANVTDYGNRQTNNFFITGSDATTMSTEGTFLNYKSNYSYPLYVESTESTSLGSSDLRAYVKQGKMLLVEGHSVFPSGLESFAPTHDTRFTGSLLNTTREGNATFSQSADGKGSTGSGTTNQVFYFEGYTPEDSPDGAANAELYFRNVTAVADAIISDMERVATQPSTTPYSASTSSGLRQQHNIFADARGLSVGSRQQHLRPGELKLEDA